MQAVVTCNADRCGQSIGSQYFISSPDFDNCGKIDDNEETDYNDEKEVQNGPQSSSRNLQRYVIKMLKWCNHFVYFKESVCKLKIF